MKSDRLSHPIINIMRTEWEYLGDRRKTFVLYILFFVIAGVISLAIPFVVGSIFNDIQTSVTTAEQLTGLQWKISILLLLSILFWLFHGPARVLEQRTGFFVRKNYVDSKMYKVLELPMKWHKDHHSGDTIDKINRASYSVEDFSSHITFRVAYAAVNFFGSVIIMFFIDWKIGVFAFLFSLAIMTLITRIDRRLVVRYRKINKFNNKYSAAVYDYLGNVSTVITLRLKKVVSKDVASKQMASYNTYRKTVVVSELKWAMTSIMLDSMIVIILVYKSSADFSLTGMIMIGTLYMLYGYLRQIGETFFNFAELYGQIVRQNANIVGAYPLDDAYENVRQQKATALPKDWKTVAMKNVAFTYDEKGKTRHLDHIDFHFSRKQKIALVGESGSGKSTVLTLIRGLYDIDHGEVYCDGKLLHGGLVGIRDHVTLIPQEPEIFNKTFRYNITMNLPFRNSELKRVMKMARLESVIKKLPNGLDTNVLEKGVSLSGGEKQRLALARGLLAARDSDILLLDEPTSSVDNMNEIKIHNQIFSKFRDKTIIASVHRLHLLDRFDYIYMFSNGKIMGEGTYDEIKTKPAFKRMMARYKMKNNRK